MAKFTVVLNVDTDQLLTTRIDAIGKKAAKAESLEEALSQELGWVNQSGISLESVVKDHPDKDILKRLADAISNDDEGADEAIVAFLRRASGKTLHKNAHGFVFKHKGKPYEIIMWQPLEHYTLQMLAEYIGL